MAISDGRRRCHDKHLMGLETCRLYENCFAASRCNMTSRMEINMTAALTRSFFFPSVFTVFSVVIQGVGHIANYEDVLVLSYGECKCLQDTGAMIRENVAHRNAPSRHVTSRLWVCFCLFFFFKLRRLDGDADVLFFSRYNRSVVVDV